MASDDEISNSTLFTNMERLKNKRNPKIQYYTQDPYNNKPKKYWDKQYILYCKYYMEELQGVKYIINFQNYLIKKHKITVSKTPGIIY